MSGAPPFIVDGGLPPSNSFVVPEDKLVYISVTKNACSSLRWMVADLAGEDPWTFFRSTAPHPTRLMTIHSRRERWEVTGRLSEMSEEELAEVSLDNGWFVFAVVRDPWTRLWSAWQSKFLVRHTGFVRNFGDEPWFPRIPEKPEDVVEDFRRFVEVHPWTTYPQLMRDAHFKPQLGSVRPDGLTYTRVYDLSAMSDLIGDLSAHLTGLGKSPTLYLPRANETPLRITREVLADGVAEQIQELYAEDFATWGDRWSLDRIHYAPNWTSDALRAVDMNAQFYERLGDVSDQAAELRRQLRATERKLARAEAHAHDPAPRRGLDRVAGRARRALGGLRRRLPL